MFDIGWSELVIIGVVALVVIGPKELPGVLRMVGQWIGKVRRMASEFQGQFNEAMREAEMADLKKQVDEIADSTRDLTSEFDPLRSMEETYDEAMADKPKAAEDSAAGAPAETERPAPPPRADSTTGTAPAEPAEPAPAAAADTGATPPKTAAGGGGG